MYYSNAAASQPRTMGVVTVVLFHVVLVAGLLAMKNPVSVFTPPTLILTTIPEILVPPEPLPVILPEEVEVSTTPPPLTFELPEFPPITAVDPLPSVPRVADTVPSTGTPSTGTPAPAVDVRQSAVFPSRIEKPPYPTVSRRLNEEGITTIEACVTPKGTVSSARLVATSGYTRLDDAAIAWIKQLRNFKPATLNGKPVADCMIVPLEWKIEVK